MTNHETPWMTTGDLAAYLKVSVETIRAWRYRGTGPKGHRMGRHVRYYRGEVDAWAGVAEPPPAPPYARRKVEVTKERLDEVARLYESTYEPGRIADFAARLGCSERQAWRLIAAARGR